MNPETAPKVTLYIPAGAFVWVNEVPLAIYVAGPTIVNVAAARFVVTFIVPVAVGAARKEDAAKPRLYRTAPRQT